MRTLLASTALWAASAALAHEGHGASDAVHGHAFDVIGMVAVIAAIGWWLWQRSQR